MILYKTLRIESHWLQVHPKIRQIVYWLSGYLAQTQDIDVIVTDLLRTREEQRALYPDEPEKKSVHQFGRGVDIGVTDIDDPKALESYINNTWPYGDGKHKTALYHTVHKDKKRGKHIHIQVMQ